MTSKLVAFTALVFFFTFGARAQGQPPREGTVPLYRVTVIDRTVSAVDYQYRNGPTPVDFRGTVLLPESKGTATVESKAGRTEIEAHFEHMQAPTRFGREYLTYVLWAITPEGHAKNLGEVLAGSSDKAKLRVTTELQAFGMIVTAEPYSAVRQPGDVVVMENQIRPDTSARTEPIQAKYELLPRGHYTYQVPENMRAAEGNGPMLSMDEYQQVVEVYQAQNAVQIAQSAGADRYAADTFAKAQQLLSDAQAAQARKAGLTAVVTLARQSAQTAEDARILAIQRKQNEDVTAAREDAAKAQGEKARAEAAARTAEAEAAANRALLEQERAARQRVEAEAAAPPAQTAPPPPAQPMAERQAPPFNESGPKTELRVHLLQQLGSVLPARDTPRGLVLTIADSDFRGAQLGAAVYSQLARIAAIVSANPGLTLEIDGHGRFSSERAYAVRDLLVRDGIANGTISAKGLGDSRPLVSNATASGKTQNRRVEIIISGSPIGEMPYWTKSYSVAPNGLSSR